MNEMNEMNDRNEKKYTYLTIGISGITFIAALAGFFILPEKIFVQLFSENSLPETSTAVFLTAGVLIVFLASLMCILGDNPKKWIAMQAVLALAVIGYIVYNYTVL